MVQTARTYACVERLRRLAGAQAASTCTPSPRPTLSFAVRVPIDRFVRRIERRSIGRSIAFPQLPPTNTVRTSRRLSNHCPAPHTHNTTQSPTEPPKPGGEPVRRQGGVRCSDVGRADRQHSRSSSRPPTGAAALRMAAAAVEAMEAPLSNGSKASSASAAAAAAARAADQSLGERVGTYLRDYFLGFVPPHIRKKGIRMPPLRVRGGYWAG